jgi:hypothetical protein
MTPKEEITATELREERYPGLIPWFTPESNWLKAKLALEEGQYLEAAGWLTCVNKMIERLAEKDYTYQAGGASKNERIALAIGDEIGTNQLAEACTRESIYGQEIHLPPDSGTPQERRRSHWPSIHFKLAYFSC